jgi:hypothetical protein
MTSPLLSLASTKASFMTSMAAGAIGFEKADRPMPHRKKHLLGQKVPLFLPMKSDDEKRDLDRALRKAQDIRFRPATAAKRAPYQDEQANRLAPGLFSRIS